MIEENRASNIVDVTPENFQQVILEASQSKLVIIDFWAPWCEACKTLMPTLEKLALEYAEHVILAKVDCDEQQAIAMQFGVRSLPTVALFKEGQPVDGFAGALPESQIREVLDKHLPRPDQLMLQQAKQQLVAGELEQALISAKQATEMSPENAEAKLVLTDCYLQSNRTAEAEALLAEVKMADQDAYYHSLVSKLELAKQASDTPEIQALQQQLEAEPDNFEVKLQLAVALNQVGRCEEALESAFFVLCKDLNFDNARKTALDIMNALPAGDELATKYRRKLYTLLY